MSARELFEYLKERNAEDLPIMIPYEDGHIFLSEMDIDVYLDSVFINN